MDESASDLLSVAENSGSADGDEGHDEPRTPPPPADARRPGGFRRRIFNAASVQDKILEK